MMNVIAQADDSIMKNEADYAGVRHFICACLMCVCVKEKGGVCVCVCGGWIHESIHHPCIRAFIRRLHAETTC